MDSFNDAMYCSVPSAFSNCFMQYDIHKILKHKHRVVPDTEHKFHAFDQSS